MRKIFEMKIIFQIVFWVTVFSCAANIEAQTSKEDNNPSNKKQVSATLHYDGLYCNSDDDGKRCLRFYDDGLVLAVSLVDVVTEADFAKVVKWFTREPVKGGKRYSEGTYEINKNNITFTTKRVYEDDREVIVDYTGTIENSAAVLVLESYSHFNGNRVKGQRYEFIKMKL